MGETDKAQVKKELRARLRKSRLELPYTEALTRSRRAQARLLASGIWQEASSAALYAATQGELRTDDLLADALARGKAVFFPRVIPGRKGAMEFVRIHAADDLVPGRFGIPEPGPELPGIPAPVFACDLAVIPGVAFTLTGLRLGFGGGFYDRFLASGLVARSVGLCFALQIVPELPAEPWDLPVKFLCTEDGLERARTDSV